MNMSSHNRAGSGTRRLLGQRVPLGPLLGLLAALAASIDGLALLAPAVQQVQEVLLLLQVQTATMQQWQVASSACLYSRGSEQEAVLLLYDTAGMPPVLELQTGSESTLHVRVHACAALHAGVRCLSLHAVLLECRILFTWASRNCCAEPRAISLASARNQMLEHSCP
jgi:hypothetical protein